MNDKWMVNIIISHYHAHIEHVNAFFVHHTNHFHGSVDLLYNAIHTTTYMMAIHLHQYLHYVPYGDWPHHTQTLVLWLT